MTRARIIPALLAAVVLVGCTPTAPDPVATHADAPYVCDGVPLAGVQSLLGEDVTVQARGAWGADGIGFGCTIDAVEEDGPALLVLERGRAGSFIGGGADDEEELRQLGTQAAAEPIDADAPGGGVLFGPQEPTAVWVCDGRELSVELLADGELAERRDDVARLLISMLPWACGGEPVPVASAA